MYHAEITEKTLIRSYAHSRITSFPPWVLEAIQNSHKAAGTSLITTNHTEPAMEFLYTNNTLAYAHMHWSFDLNKTPLAPAGYDISIYDRFKERTPSGWWQNWRVFYIVVPALWLFLELFVLFPTWSADQNEANRFVSHPQISMSTYLDYGFGLLGC